MDIDKLHELRDAFLEGKTSLDESTSIICNPPKGTAQQKGVFVRDGRAHFFTKGNVLKMQRDWADILRPFRERLSQPLEGAIDIHIVIVYPHNKSSPKRLLNALIPHTTRPDADNIEKGLFDAMTTMAFWRDDSQIFSHQTEKYKGFPAVVGVYITIREYRC